MTTFDRSIARITEYEFRAASADGGLPRFYGYAAVFNSDSEPLPFIETISPGAFARTLKNDRNTAFVIDHDESRVLSSRKTGRLQIGEDSKGLIVESDLPNTSYARDLVELHDAGEVRGMSFTFRPTKGGEMWSADGKRRTLTDVKLGHVTAVTAGYTPAYRATTASIRSLANTMGVEVDQLDDALDAIRNGSPLSRDAVTLVGRAITATAPEGVRWSSAANDASSATYALSTLLALLGNETDDATQSGLLRAAIDSLQSFIAAETAEIGTAADAMASRIVPISLARAQLELRRKAR